LHTVPYRILSENVFEDTQRTFCNERVADQRTSGGVRALDDGDRDLSGGRPPGCGDDGEVADAADVSQGYVYEVAETLVDRGLVIIDESTSPTVLRARPASEAVAELSTRLSDLQSAIEDAYAEPDATDVWFEVVR